MQQTVAAGKGQQKNKEKYLGRLVLERKGYVCRRILGEGAFAQVYCVEIPKEGKLCACKVSEREGFLKREAEVMAALQHPLFPVCMGYWKEAGLGFLLSEYVAGSTLEEMLNRRGRFTVDQVVRVGLALGEGLLVLHERPEQYLFRDVKPANVMIRQDGNVKLIDLGCVCSMKGRNHARAGTPGFAAPEQLAAGEGLTAACDVYGLGRTLEAMLGTEERPFRIGRERRLRHVLRKCTEADPGRRVADMKEFLAAMKKVSRGEAAL